HGRADRRIGVQAVRRVRIGVIRVAVIRVIVGVAEREAVVRPVPAVVAPGPVTPTPTAVATPAQAAVTAPTPAPVPAPAAAVATPAATVAAPAAVVTAPAADGDGVRVAVELQGHCVAAGEAGLRRVGGFIEPELEQVPGFRGAGPSAERQ